MGKKEDLEKLVDSISEAKSNPELYFEGMDVKPPSGLKGKHISDLEEGLLILPDDWLVVPSYSDSNRLVIVGRSDRRAIGTYFSAQLAQLFVENPKKFYEQTFTLQNVLDGLDAEGYSPASTSN